MQDHREEVRWEGGSRTIYRYRFYFMNALPVFINEPGNIIFAKEDEYVDWSPLLIDETDNLKEYFADKERLWDLRKKGVTHLHFHPSTLDSQKRRDEKTDLIEKYQPEYNK